MWCLIRGASYVNNKNKYFMTFKCSKKQEVSGYHIGMLKRILSKYIS